MRSPTLAELPPPPPERRGWPWTVGTPARGRPEANLPRISIVMPSFNQVGYLEEAIRSVLLQDYPDVELLIVDGGSQDGSVDVIRKYEPWIAWWTSGPDGGQSEAIRRGIDKATGGLRNWINSDDLLCQDALWPLGDVYRRAPRGAAVLCGHGFYVDAASRVLLDLPIQTTTAPILPGGPPLQGGVQGSWFFTPAAWDRVGGIDAGLKYTMDTDLYFRFADAGVAFIAVDAYVAAYREHDATKTHAGWRDSVEHKRRFYGRRLGRLPPDERARYEPVIRRFLYGRILRSIHPGEPWRRRIEKVLSALREFPQALREPAQVRRLGKLVLPLLL